MVWLRVESRKKSNKLKKIDKEEDTKPKKKNENPKEKPGLNKHIREEKKHSFSVPVNMGKGWKSIKPLSCYATDLSLWPFCSILKGCFHSSDCGMHASTQRINNHLKKNPEMSVLSARRKVNRFRGLRPLDNVF